MAIKLVALLAIGLAVLAISEARHVPGHRYHHRQQFEQRALISKPHGGPQSRVFPGAVAIKKLVLLKFKKIVPISLILLKSSNENEAELVPVYPTDQIPENVQFIPTPNGISGHKDVQAIAIPSELHDQLQINGLSNLENIEALLQSSSISSADSEGESAAVGNSIAVAQPEDLVLDQPENDEDQLLDGAAAAAPASVAPVAASAPGLRRLSADELLRSGVRNSAHLQQTSVEEIPLLLYSANDGSSSGSGSSSSQGRRYVAATPARRRQQQFYN
ncbi:uncharacterized protein DMAD_00707 [Drosophila madeirensis]|uniref:Folded gastrulation n=1 Tax=Drosophila madeirensis TaxID=30013 RepID=A0AAU9FZB0_DROMD|nr:uncharacterized protein LOC117889719 [Drosophila subobscura]